MATPARAGSSAELLPTWRPREAAPPHRTTVDAIAASHAGRPTRDGLQEFGGIRWR
jgi:hypothetical protein